MTFAPAAWASFVDGVKSGEFDLLQRETAYLGLLLDCPAADPRPALE